MWTKSMLTRTEPWTAMHQLQEEMNRVFGNVLTREDDASSIVTSRWTPAVDIKVENDRFVIHADVPGVDPQDIEVTMENGVLTIKGERAGESSEEDDNGYRRLERMHGVFHRRFSLPDTADADGISATGKNGVLEVVIPKKAALQPKRIKVDAVDA
ncbi:MAG: Hsp20/alpha crystallin family protein [Methyloligellaceae bacterium]